MKYRTYSQGQLCNQLYYVLQAYIQGFTYVVAPLSINGNDMYQMLCRLGCASFISREGYPCEHICSYCQCIGRDFRLDQIRQFIRDVVLKSDAFASAAPDPDGFAVHIRNGDYLDPRKGGYHDCFDRRKYLADALSQAKLENGAQRVCVFSDDINMCRRIYGGILQNAFSEVAYAEGGSAVDDFVRLSCMRTKVLWNSTFSYWSAFVGNVLFENSEKSVYAPSAFSKSEHALTRCDPAWNLVQVKPR